MKKVLAVTLGILTAIGGFVDIGDLVANAETGARFGMGLGWVVVVGVVGICVYAEMVTSVHHLLWVPVAAFVVRVVLWRVRFETVERVFGLAGLALVVFVVALVQLDPSWRDLDAQAVEFGPAGAEDWPTYAFFGVTFGAALETGPSSGYTVAQYFGRRWGKRVPPRQAAPSRTVELARDPDGTLVVVAPLSGGRALADRFGGALGRSLAGPRARSQRGDDHLEVEDVAAGVRAHAGGGRRSAGPGEGVVHVHAAGRVVVVRRGQRAPGPRARADQRRRFDGGGLGVGPVRPGAERAARAVPRRPRLVRVTGVRGDGRGGEQQADGGRGEGESL
ncbi:hypothetical protein [Actinosynnema mirum]|uniref:Uncharacterized protein n=1 Tax=Actinosynnema mirum (strain ATCC 29888 / DSM 43827 / JCM 3225 / NBRC 14064 / NCIMB 13271 / NRRL B-12336 / IMRU 3971 / 101) TaxID=446462 RepID=C6W9N4_ACTMD|nr:hypothetical protein [Actinosynnema mirum]ACU37251.1 hypothetical protein Amir_3349 [Actinosynnema mirum DSM 43827]